MTVPTTIEELREAIGKDWVTQEMSPARAGVHIWRNAEEGSFYLPHVSWDSNGPISDGVNPYIGRQRYFTPEDAVRAFWNSYRLYYDDQQTSLNRKPSRICWRVHPEMKEEHGAYRVFARFATVWLSDDGLIGDYASMRERILGKPAS